MGIRDRDLATLILWLRPKNRSWRRPGRGAKHSSYDVEGTAWVGCGQIARLTCRAFKAIPGVQGNTLHAASGSGQWR